MESAHTQHVEPDYLKIMYGLAVLTVLEVGAIYLPMSKLVIGGFLVLFAMAKAVTVALFFMHLKFERRTLGVIALSPMVLCVFLIFMLLPDLTSSNREPPPTPQAASTSPGH